MNGLTVLRDQVAAALTGLDSDWVVLPEPTDAVTPPCFMLDWGPDPWTARRTMCAYDTQLEILVVPGRLTTEGVYPILEDMVAAAVGALEQAGFPAYQVMGPGPLEIAQITWLAARLQVRHQVGIDLPAPPPVPGEAVWAWGDLTPAQVGGTSYLTVPGDPMFLAGAVANGIEYVAQSPGTIEGVRFWRHGADPTPSRRLGVWWWHPGTQDLGHVTVATDGEAGRTEGWVQVDLDDPIRLAVVDELHARFIVLAEVPLGSGFYRSPWTESQTGAVKHQRPRGRPLGQWPPPTGTWPDWPPPDVYPSGSAPGVSDGFIVWTDVLYRPSN